MRRRVAAGVLAGVSVLTACTADPLVAEPDAQTTPSGAVVEVVRRDMVDAVALTAVVEAGQTYTVTVPGTGKLVREGDRYGFRSGDGPVDWFDLPATVVAVETLVAEGVDVAPHTPVLRVTDAAMMISADVSPAQILRFGHRLPQGARAQLEGSTGPFDCALVDPLPSAVDGVYRQYCRLPEETPAVAGLTGKLVIALDTHEDVLAVPVEAVAGTIEKGSVYPAGSDAARTVTLGITDGVYVEVSDGVREGERLRVPSPSILD